MVLGGHRYPLTGRIHGQAKRIAGNTQRHGLHRLSLPVEHAECTVERTGHEDPGNTRGQGGRARDHLESHVLGKGPHVVPGQHALRGAVHHGQPTVRRTEGAGNGHVVEEPVRRHVQAERVVGWALPIIERNPVGRGLGGRKRRRTTERQTDDHGEK